jgi:hypothetical protein
MVNFLVPSLVLGNNTFLIFLSQLSSFIRRFYLSQVGSVVLLIQMSSFVSSSSIETHIRHKRNSFVCPGKGKWPDETDCAK